jgi:Leucine-rich repeat (LRR) protein
MSKEPADKHQILLKGGEYKESIDSIENWLDFLMDPANLKVGLQPLTVNCLNYHGTFGSSIYVQFSEIKPSLKYLRLRLDSYEELLLPVFQETNEEQKALLLTDKTYASVNPYCLRNWIFGLFKNTELEHLDVRFLNAELPDLFDELPKLKFITLSHTKIRCLPPSFYRLPALVELDISNSGISEVPAELGQLQALKKLTFSQSCLPIVLGSFRKLTSLNCTKYRFDVPIEVTRLTELKNLSLSSVNSAPYNFLNFPHLESLYFRIERKHAAFKFTECNMPCLKKLSINYLDAFSTSIANFVSLETFVLHEGFNKPRDFQLTKPEHETLTNAFAQLKNLKSISFEDSGIVDMKFCLAKPDLEYINLSRNMIVDVPDGLEKFSNLKKLDLSMNKIVHVPQELVNLAESGILNLKNNPFPGFPKSASKESEMKKSILSKGGTHTISHKEGESMLDWLQFITDPQHLQPGLPDLLITTDRIYFEDSTLTVSFDLDKPSLRSLKFELGDFEEIEIFVENLQAGIADKARQSHLKKWIFNLFHHTELEELRMPFLNTELPDRFGSLIKLQWIDFSKSKITSLPPSFCQLSVLKTLSLSETALTELPANIYQLKNLVTINLSGCALTKLPQELFLLPNLENLNIEGTAITELPDSFNVSSMLRDINLSGSKISQLPASFVHLHNLETLYLEGSAITDLSNRLNALSNLKNISLYKSKLKELPSGFFQLPLEWLDIRDSSLQEIPVELGESKTLKYLAFTQSCVPAVWKGLTELTELHCYCPDFHIPEEFSGLVNLKELHLNSVSSASSKSLNLPKLESLELKVSGNYSPFSLQGNFPNLKLLTTNYFQAFASCLINAKNLEKIIAGGKFDKAHIQLLNESFKYLNELIHLELRGMGISNMEFCTSAFNLKYLDLSENEIADIPTSLSNLQKLERLLLNRNPLVDFPELDVMPALISIQFAETKMPQDKESPSDHPDSVILKRMASNFPNAFLMYEL